MPKLGRVGSDAYREDIGIIDKESDDRGAQRFPSRPILSSTSTARRDVLVGMVSVPQFNQLFRAWDECARRFRLVPSPESTRS